MKSMRQRIIALLELALENMKKEDDEDEVYGGKEYLPEIRLKIYSHTSDGSDDFIMLARGWDPCNTKDHRINLF